MSLFEMIISILATSVSVVAAIWLIPIYIKLSKNEQAIRANEDEIDAVEPDIDRRTNGHLINEKQRVAQINVSRQPLYRQLERLKQERQFLLDKLPFFKK